MILRKYWSIFYAIEALNVVSRYFQTSYARLWIALSLDPTRSLFFFSAHAIYFACNDGLERAVGK